MLLVFHSPSSSPLLRSSLRNNNHTADVFREDTVPRAIATTLTEHHELKTLPGGFVEVRRLTYGEVLQRRTMMKMEIQGQGQKDARAEIEMMSRKATEFDFQKCIVDHNLFADDAETRKLNLASGADLGMLDPRVGQEIEQILDKLNNYDLTEEEEGNSNGGSETSSS
jgi:hypothetical protein